MKLTFWVRRFSLVFISLFCVLFAVYSHRGGPTGWAMREAVTWSFIASTIYLISGLYYLRRGKPCALCAGGDGTSTEEADAGVASKPRR